MNPRTVRLITDRPTLQYGPSTNFMHQKSTDKKDRMKDAQELVQTRRIDGLSGTSRTVRSDLTDSLPGAKQHSRVARKTTSTFRSMDLPMDLSF
jgi:hypothetical protein